MGIDASIPLAGIRPAQAEPFDLIGKHTKLAALSSLLEQRQFARDEAKRRHILTNIQLLEGERAASARRTAGLKATKSGKLDRDMYLNELLAAGEIEAAREVNKDFSTADKNRSDSRSKDIETRSRVMEQGHSLVQGIDEVGRQFGYDHPVTIRANRQAIGQFNQLAEMVGMDPVPIQEGAVDPQQLQAAIQHFRTAKERLEEFKAQPESVRAGTAFDRQFNAEPGMDTSGHDPAAMSQADQDLATKYLLADAPVDNPVQLQTFMPEEIRPLEEGGNVPGQESQMFELPRVAVDTPAAPRPSLAKEAMMREAKGKAGELYSWDPNTGQMVRNDSVFRDKEALAKAGATRVSQSVEQRELSKEAMKALGDDRKAATGYLDSIYATQKAEEMLQEGIYSGSLADWRVKAEKLTGLVGGDTSKAARTEQFLAYIGKVVIPQLVAFGGNDSNEELRYLQRVNAGEVTFEESTLKAVLADVQRNLRRRVKTFNEDVEAVSKEVRAPGNIRQIEVPPEAAPPEAASTPAPAVRRYNRDTRRIE